MPARAMSASALLKLLTVAECGSISRAAELLHVSQPSLTRSVREFESRLGEKVFERTAKGVTPTPLGATLMERARAIRAEVRQAQLNVDRFRTDHRQAIRIGAVSVHPIMQFAQAIIETRQAHSAVHVSILTGTQDEMVHMLNEGAVDMVFGRLLPREGASPFKQEALYLDEASVFCAASHQLARKEAVSIADLAGCRWILGPPGSMMRGRVEELFAGHGLAPSVAIEVEEVVLRRVLMLESDYLSAFQVHHVHNELSAGRAVKLPFRFEHAGQWIGALRLTEHSAFSSGLMQSLRTRYRDSGFIVP